MTNLTSFRLAGTSQVSMRPLLDFFENAPRLRDITLHIKTPISDAQNGRLASLGCLKDMWIAGGLSPLLFGHLLIPVGARLGMEVDLPIPLIENHPLRFLDNLGNFSNFTEIDLY